MHGNRIHVLDLTRRPVQVFVTICLWSIIFWIKGEKLSLICHF